MFIEHETAIEDPKETERILEAIGFKVYCIVDKVRMVYRLGSILINLEDIKGFRPAIELEIIDDKDAEKHKETLRKLLRDLEIPEENLIKRSISNLYMREYASR